MLKVQVQIHPKWHPEIQKLDPWYQERFIAAGHCGRLLTKKEFKDLKESKSIIIEVPYKERGAKGSFTVRFHESQLKFVNKYALHLKSANKLYDITQKLYKELGTSEWNWGKIRCNEMQCLATDLHFDIKNLTSLLYAQPMYGVPTTVSNYLGMDSKSIRVRAEMLDLYPNPDWIDPPSLLLKILKPFYFKKSLEPSVVYAFPGLRDKAIKLTINENVSYQE